MFQQTSMAKKDFTLNMSQENMRIIHNMQSAFLSSMQELLYFSFETEPNIERNDIFNARIQIDNGSIITFDAVVLDICPPLPLPPTDEKYKTYEDVASKYLKSDLLSTIKSDYFSEKKHQKLWTVFFKQSLGKYE